MHHAVSDHRTIELSAYKVVTQNNISFGFSRIYINRFLIDFKNYHINLDICMYAGKQREKAQIL